MDYCFLNGFLVVLLTRHCASEGLSTSNQSLSVVSLRDVQPLPHEPEVPPADVVPVVAPPVLKEVQQVMQEASEKVESHAAEEVLKELLEKVVEAAMGQVEGGGESKADEAAVQEGVTKDALGAEQGGSDTKEVLEQVEEEKEVKSKDMGAKGGDTVFVKEQVVAEVDTFKDIAEEGKGDVKGKGVTAAASMEETTAGIETGDRDGVEVINESLDTEVSQGEMAAASEETGREITVQEAEVEDNNEQVVLSKEKGAAETETNDTEETPPVVQVALGEEQESVEKSDPDLVVVGVEQPRDAGRKEGALAEETQVDEMKSDIITLPSDSYDIETRHTVVGELAEEEKEVNHAEGSEGDVVVEGEVAGEEEVEGTDLAEAATRGETDGDSEGSEKLVNEKGDRRAGEEAHVAPETSHGTKTEDQEVPVISAPVPEYGAEASVEQSFESQAPTQSPSLGGVETGENTLDEDKSNHDNEIISTPTDDLLPNDPVVAHPTLDNFVKDVLAQHPESERDEPGGTSELVEDTAGTTETSEPGLEAWKIGAISAAVFLIVETAVIVFYILKCRNKNSAPALQRACEEGCVEPEEATGGDCSDDTLPADSGDNEQIATLDPPDVASTLTHNKEQHGAEHATAMSDFPSGTTEEVGNAAPGPECSQDLRTSML